MSVREVHLVYADADYAMDGAKVGNPVSYATSSQQSGFIRQNSKGICFDKYQNMLCNTALDGSTTAQTTPKPDGFSVVSLVVTNHVSDALLLGRIGTFCNERNLVFGGVKLAEVIVFENMQSEERRRAIDAKLLKKWRGIGEGATIGVSMPSVTVAPGAEANILLKGEDGVATFSRIDVVYDGTDSGALVVGGAVDVSSSATVSVSLASGVRKVRGGTRVKILEADSLLNADGVGSWTLTLPAGSRASAHLVVDGNAVYAEFECRGTILVVQ